MGASPSASSSMGRDDSAPCDPPDPGRVYRNYLRTCRRLGVEPVPGDRAKGLIREWTDTLAASGSVPPPPTH